jgi:hypothetical protein
MEECIAILEQYHWNLLVKICFRKNSLIEFSLLFINRMLYKQYTIELEVEMLLEMNQQYLNIQQ